MALQMGRNAYRLDVLSGECRRSVFVVFLGLVGISSVVQREVYWIAIGSVLWAMVSTDRTKHMALPHASVFAPEWRVILLRAGLKRRSGDFAMVDQPARIRPHQPGIGMVRP